MYCGGWRRSWSSGRTDRERQGRGNTPLWACPRRGSLRNAGLRLARCLVIVAAASTLDACIHYTHTAYQPQAEAETPRPTVAPAFSYPRTPIAFANDTIENDPAAPFDVRHVQLPSIGDNGQPGNRVTADYYRQRGGDDQRLIIVLPIWGRQDGYPPVRIAEGIAKRFRDINVLRVRGPNGLMDWERLKDIDSEAEFETMFERYAGRFRVNVVDTRRLIDWAEQRPEIDGGRVGVIGFSIGAIATAVLIANEPRLRAGIVAMGALEPAKILTQCGGQRGQARAAVMERLGWNRQDYREAIEPYFAPMDEWVDGSWPEPERLLVFDARFDRCMPRASQDKLWRRLGEPERVSISAGHRSAFLAMTFIGFYFINHWIYDFVDENL